MQSIRIQTHPTGDRRHGGMLIMIAVMLTAFLVMAAFTVDVAYMQLVRTQLRSAVDAAAKSAGEVLAREQDPVAAVAAAQAIAQQNTVDGQPLQLAASDIILGRSEPNQNGTWSFQAGATPYTAVRVRSRLDNSSANGPVNLIFGKIVGDGEFSPQHTSVASHLHNDVVLALDRSHSMCFDMSGISWSYPSGNPYPSVLGPGPMEDWMRGLTSPPHPDDSRWAALVSAINVFLSEANAVSRPPDVALVTWGSEITLSHYEGNLTGRTFPEVSTDAPLASSYSGITSSIATRSADIMLGGTNIAAGIDTSRSMLNTTGRPLANKTIILLTDGQQTAGTDPLLSAQAAAADGIVIHTVTMITAGGQQAMADIAAATGGRHIHAENEAQLRDAFEELARSLPVALTD